MTTEDDFGIDSDEDTEAIANSPTIVFDIETGPVWIPGNSPKKAMEHCMPLGIERVRDDPPGSFDPASVKVGTMKDPVKIADKIETVRAKHEAAVQNHQSNQEKLDAGFWEAVIESAALSPITGRVLAIGYFQQGEYAVEHIDDVGEYELIKSFWSRYNTGRKLTGWNINGFDVPFLLARSARYGIQPPKSLYSRGKWLTDQFVDLQAIFGKQYCPWKQSYGHLKAKNVAKFLGVYKRSEDGIEGKDFWRYYCSKPPEAKAIAMEYLQHDVIEEACIANRLGVLT